MAQAVPSSGPLTLEQIETRLRSCPHLPSLGSINSALRELLNADQRYTSQVAEVIRRDPSLTARLLRMVNSVYYALSSPVNSIEEAVFYLGIRQIRQLVMVTPVIEDFQKLAGQTPFRWREFWQHCIGTAILTREVLGAVYTPMDEADYVAGLVHDVGKIAMASAFPDHFSRIHRLRLVGPQESRQMEREILGLDHTELGALYLRNHNLPDILIDTARYHHEPERASQNAQVIAAVQIANLLVRHAEIGVSGDADTVSEEQCLTATGWSILFPNQSESERAIARANLQRSLDRLPTILEGLV
jgi:putative nucleotidyltransferase with HDIG domain